MNTTYKPIDCGYHDQLEAAAVKRERVQIQYFTRAGESKTAIGVIQNIETTGGEEFLHLDSGETIRLDHIVKLNEVTFPGYENQC